LANTAEKMVADLIGQAITRVAIEQWSIHIVLESSVINVEGRWKLFDRDGTPIDVGSKDVERQDFRLWRALGTRIVQSSMTSDHTLSLELDNGFRFQAEADHDGFEDWQIAAQDGSLLIVNDKVATEFGPRAR
jgi:hypothetical protein